MVSKINKKITFRIKEPAKIKRNIELENNIKHNWSEFIKGKSNYFNGDIFVIGNKIETDNVYIYEVNKAKYADLVYAKTHSELTILSLFAAILFKTKDNYYVFIQNNHDVVNIIGGLASIEDFIDGLFKPEVCLSREVTEEIGLDINNKNDVLDYNIAYLTSPSNNENVFPFGIVFTGTLNYTKEELIEYYLNNNEKFDNEIKKLLFYNSSNYFELNNIENKEI